MKNLQALRSLAIAASALVITASAMAQGVITSPGGGYKTGLSANGNLWEPASYIGLQRVSDGYDPINPGSPREAWGVSAGASSGLAEYTGTLNLLNNSSVYGLNTASTSSNLIDGLGIGLLRVNQVFDWAAENVLRICVDITNISGSSQNVLFSRHVDWDTPAAFYNYTTADALVGPVIDASYFGFESADPLAAFFSSSGPAGGTFGPADLGGAMLIDLGSLADGQSSSFYIYHALNTIGQNSAGLRGQLYGLGASFVITGVDQIDAETGAGDRYVAAIAYGPKNVVPEPGTVAMLIGFGVAGLAVVRRRK